VRFEEAIADLEGRQPESMPGPSLERIRAVTELLDHPELTAPTVHVTGTNGKTTTARLVMSLACAHGLRTGLYTSPHLETVRERLSVCGEPITEEEFAETYEHLLPFLELVDGRSEIRVTYFETLTALTYLWFTDRPVDLAVFEVGIGGSWDATNLIRSEVAVLCPIGLDHMKQLGSTVAEIAVEKAGIVKETSTAVVREQRPEALEVIQRRCEEMGAPLLLEGRDFRLAWREQAVGGQVLTIEGTRGTYQDVFLPLYGEEAARNAAAAVVAMEVTLGRELDRDVVVPGLRDATSPGRVEVIARRPTVVLDGGHNEDAVRALVRTMNEVFGWGRLHLVVAMFADKRVEDVVAILADGLADSSGARPILGYAARNSGERSAPAERVAEAMRAAGLEEVREFPDVRAALEAVAAEARPEDLVLVTGSFYTVGDARVL
jgi:dihydrofolate synthase/folylpolyglutamate synthase